jgi:Transglutaminase-like superfamily
MTKKIALILCLLLFNSILFAQDKINNLTLKIVDTSKNQAYQAKDIYNWITENIAYDTKQLQKGNKNYTPEQTIEKRKAVCYGYSQLFYEMCQDINIESYIINGYCKGFGYVNGEHFTKSNHSWNIIYADSSWIIIDATWGSGSLKYNPSLQTKLKSFFFKKQGIKTEIQFIKNNNDKFFGISPHDAIKSHFPIDIKWQLLEFPISYNYFIENTIDSIVKLNYKSEIKKIRGHDFNYQQTIDAINSIKYNPYNKFDAALAYFNLANQFIVTSNTIIDSSLIEPINESINYYNKAINYIKDFKSISNSFYKSIKQDHKKVFKKTSKTYEKIIDNIHSFSFSNKKAVKRIHKMDSILINTSVVIDSLNLFFINNPITDTTINNAEITDLKSGLSEKIKELEISKNIIKEIIETQYEVIHSIDSIISDIDELYFLIHKISLSIENMDEYNVFRSCSILNSKYLIFDSIVDLNKRNEEILIEKLIDCFNVMPTTLKVLKQIAKNDQKYINKNGGSGIDPKNKKEILNLIIEFSALKEEIQIIFNQQNSILSEIIIKNEEFQLLNRKNNHSFITSSLPLFYNYTKDKNEKSYVSDINKYDYIKSSSKERIKYLKMIKRKI